MVAVCLTRLESAQGLSVDPLTATIADVQVAVRSGALTYERLVQHYLARIAAYDKRGPTLNAVIAINPRAVELAKALDDERRAKGVRGPLHGIPVAVKDNIDTADLPTTGGTPVFAGSMPARDAHVIERLRRPTHYKICGTELKVALKRAVRGLIPDEIIDRPKKGFSVPIRRWFRGELKEFLSDCRLSPRALQRGYFRPDALRELLRQHTSGQRDWHDQLWNLAMLELWHQRFIDRT